MQKIRFLLGAPDALLYPSGSGGAYSTPLTPELVRRGKPPSP